MNADLEAFNFQKFVVRRFGVGKMQYLTLLTLGLVEMNDGIQAITISLLTPILKEQLDLDQNQVSFLTSIFYIGVGLGALISGIQSNHHGRRFALLLGTIIQFISAVFLAVNASYTWLCVCRLLYGIGFGSTLAVATVIITELMPMTIRGKSLLVINFINSVGKLGGVGLAFIFIEGEHKYVSQYMLASAIFCLITVILVCLFVKQSYRYLLFRQKYTQAFKIMNEIIADNCKDAQKLSQNESNELIVWSKQAFNESDTKVTSFQLLASHKRLAILLSISWFFINFIFFGEMFIIPFMLGTKTTGLMQYFWMTLGEIPTLLLTYTLIQRKGCGRRTSLILFYSMTGVLCLLTIDSMNSLTLFFTKMFMKAIFQMLYPFTSESYPTSARAIGFAVNSFCGRLGSTIMPFIIFPLYNSYPNSPFLLLALLSFFGALCIFQIKQDTLLKPLDDTSQFNISGQKRLNTEQTQQIQIKIMQSPL